MHKIKRLMASFAAAIVSLSMLPMTASAASGTSVVYDAVPKNLPPNVVSQGFECCQTAEIGDYVHLAGTDRGLKKVTVTMSDWALYSDYASDARYSSNKNFWKHPITLNIYDDTLGADGVPTTLLATTTQDVQIPWRPAGDPSCPDTGYGAGFAWKASDGQCYNGKAFNAAFDMSNLNVVLPDDIIIGVAYNTADYGAAPIHQAGPYNSLNVAVPENNAATVGTDDDSNAVFWNTGVASWYADGGAGGSGTFREDTNWAPYGTVALRVETRKVDTNECKNNGWKKFRGHKFKNQNDCVSYCQRKHRNDWDQHRRKSFIRFFSRGFRWHFGR